MKRPSALKRYLGAGVGLSLAAAIGAALVGFPGAPASPAAASVAPASLSFHETGLDGGGFVNVVATDPNNPSVVLAGTDVAGIYRSSNGGALWAPANTGVLIGGNSVAAFAFSPTLQGKVYAAVGSAGVGGLVVSTDDGVTWQTRSTYPGFNGGNGRPGRTAGNLLLVDPASGDLFAGTWNQGVLRSSDDGKTWIALGLAGDDIRSLAFDGGQRGALLVGTWGGGVYRISGASGSQLSTAKLSGAPAGIATVQSVGSIIFATAGADGIYASSDDGATWHVAYANPSGSPAKWVGLWAQQTGAGVSIVAGANTPGRDGTGYDSIVTSADGGGHWSSLTAAGQVQATEGGPTGSPWWMAATQPAMTLGQPSYFANYVTSPRPGVIYVSGRLDVYATFDAGAHWYPMVSGLGSSEANVTLVDPANPSDVHVGMPDWTDADSADGLSHVSSSTHALTFVTGTSAALDATTSPATVLAGVGYFDGSNSGGEIYANSDPLGGSPWTSEGLGAATGGYRPQAIAAGTYRGASVILAAVQGHGVWRKYQGAWTLASPTNGPMTVDQGWGASFVWQAGSSVVYLWDRGSGIWRSADAGATWSEVLASRCNQHLGCAMAIDPADPTVLVADSGSTVFRLTNLGVGPVGVVVASTVGSSGPMAFAQDNSLWLAVVNAGNAPALLRSTDLGKTWTSEDDALYRAAANSPNALTFDPSGNLYVSLRGGGVIKGTWS